MATSRRHAYCSQATILCHFVLLWLVCGLGWSFAVPRNFASSLQNAVDTLVGKKSETSESGRGLREEGGPALSVGVAAAQYEVLQVYDHDASAFTQGLGWYQGKLYESTGMQGQSEVRIIDLETGEVLKRQQLPSYVFGEGMVIHEGIVHQITWHHKQVSCQSLHASPHAADDYEWENHALTLVLQAGGNLVRTRLLTFGARSSRSQPVVLLIRDSAACSSDMKRHTLRMHRAGAMQRMTQSHSLCQSLPPSTIAA
eukprot:TRINITY_DN60_c1_g1_i5.p1 TRINITY_DN60_c1_g1~~TRINITY_DN60_c1_g1_i5.p1  ORF type:complete len:256 (-),score=35.20 TRINITY_DN60_c1_g1_i5:1132-1899(-)